MSYQIGGLDSLMRKLNSMGGNAQKALGKAVDNTTLSAQTSAKMRAPVDTGNLRDHIFVKTEHTSNKSEGTVYDNVEYAIYQELGTSKMAAQPYMMPALEENKTTFEMQARMNLISAIRKLGG